MRYWVPIPFVLNLIQFVTLAPNTQDPSWPTNVRQCALMPGQLQVCFSVDFSGTFKLALSLY